MGYKQRNIDYMEQVSEVIAEMETRGNVSDKCIRNMVYNLGIYAFRMYHDAGFPVDKRFPGLNRPSKKWSPVFHRFIDERYLESMEAEARHY